MLPEHYTNSIIIRLKMTIIADTARGYYNMCDAGDDTIRSIKFLKNIMIHIYMRIQNTTQ